MRRRNVGSEGEGLGKRDNKGEARARQVAQADAVSLDGGPSVP